jgi:hypothetical protein
MGETYHDDCLLLSRSLCDDVFWFWGEVVAMFLEMVGGSRGRPERRIRCGKIAWSQGRVLPNKTCAALRATYLGLDLIILAAQEQRQAGEVRSTDLRVTGFNCSKDTCKRALILAIYWLRSSRLQTTIHYRLLRCRFE